MQSTQPNSPSAMLDADVQAALVARAGKWTPMRAAVFAALWSAAKPVSAYDVLDAVNSTRSSRAQVTSIYRVLQLFVDANIAFRVESASAFAANRNPLQTSGSGLKVCKACGCVEWIVDDRIVSLLENAAQAVGFSPSRRVIELYGTCRDCSV